MPFISGFILLFFWDKNSLISRVMDILLDILIVKLVLSSQSAISQEWPLNAGFFFSDCSIPHHCTRLCEKNRKKKKKKERERESKKEERKPNSHN